MSKDKQVEVIRLPPPILAMFSKRVLEKSKNFNKKGNIAKIKENFLNLLAKKIKNIHRIINDSGKVKLRINITTKGSSRKQIIISMNNDNKSKFIAFLNLHITNLNSVLRNIKSEIIADFI